MCSVDEFFFTGMTLICVKRLSFYASSIVVSGWLLGKGDGLLAALKKSV